MRPAVRQHMCDVSVLMAGFHCNCHVLSLTLYYYLEMGKEKATHNKGHACMLRKTTTATLGMQLKFCSILAI